VQATFSERKKMQQQPSDNEPFDVLSQIVPRLVHFVIKSWGTAVEVFLRKDFGAEYLGTQAAFVLLLIPIYIAMAPEFDPRPMLIYLVGYIGMCLVHRISVIRRNWRGEYGHQYYNGVPRLGRYFPKLSEVAVKTWIEPLAVLGCGLLLIPLFPPLGLFLLIGEGCALFRMLDWDLRMRRQAREMHDAMIEQEAVADRFRELRGDRYR